MFERYICNINREEERFQAFLSNYIAEKGVKDIQALPYSELYKVIKEGIQEYLRKQEPRPRSEK
jgi:predicted transcriptional regulator